MIDKILKDIKGLFKVQDKAKFLKQNIPYLAFFYLGNIFAHHVRSYIGGDVIDKIFQGILELNTMSFLPSIHPVDISIGKKNKQDTFYNEHTAEIILFENAKKYLKEHLGESKTLNISKWKSEVITLRKEKDSLYSQIIDLRKEVEQAESVRNCINKLLQENSELTQVKKQELGL